ncbi:uncharacterized protein FA14DRAFT_186765 [Meira miltonrushii]|uniref:pH-response transcription factor pacC/RIM101 n=1 Tax=Meira miltonrushii TaxID=1280837 RepID=A0A316VG15_9BASI|nr:uncharacterized protein FA14DRAFT_186765 [Meira miltonrushii]PWN36559.1 hypothetical protein FA14DRAFT_186765 [Meira miltonrushii]
MSFSNAINIPSGSNSTMEMMSNEFTSPISISSPFSSSSGNASAAEQMMFASSFATITSPPTSDDFALSTQQEQKKHKPHKCDICNACFARKVHLQRHALRHQNGKPYCCDRCGKCFSRQDSLVRHHRLLHENMVKETKPSKATVMAGKKTKKQSKRACIRCSSITVKCDGKQPCSRCVSNHGGESCLYAPTSAPTTIGQASKKRSRQRHDSIATTSSMVTIDDDDGSFSGPRRDTASSVASTMSDAFMSPIPANSWGQQLPVLSVYQQSQMQQQIPPHPFELPQMDAYVDSSKSLDFMAGLPNFFPSYPQQHQQMQPQYPSVPMFDWSSLCLEEDTFKLPFSGSASNKDLNGTLLSDDVRMASLTQDSTFPSPSIHALQQHNLHMHDLANQQFGRVQSLPATNGGDLSAFAMAVAQNNQCVTNIDGLMRSLSGYGMRNGNNGESLVV